MFVCARQKCATDDDNNNRNGSHENNTSSRSSTATNISDTQPNDLQYNGIFSAQARTREITRRTHTHGAMELNYIYLCGHQKCTLTTPDCVL